MAITASKFNYITTRVLGKREVTGHYDFHANNSEVGKEKSGSNSIKENSSPHYVTKINR